MAQTAAQPPPTSKPASALSGGKGGPTRVSRESRGLADLTPSQKIAKQNVQGAQNACKFIKDYIDKGHIPPADVLQACSTLTGALAVILSE